MNSRRVGTGRVARIALNVLGVLVALVMAAVLLASGGHVAAAQDAVPEIIVEQQAAIDRLKSRADAIERQVEASSEDDDRLVELRAELETLAQEILKAGVAFRPRLTEINTRLELLGAAPAEGQPPEAEMVARERAALLSEKSQINVMIGEAEAQSLRVNRMVDTVAGIRRDLFAQTLSKRYEIDYTLLFDVIGAFQGETRELISTVGSWLSFVLRFKLPAVLGATFFAVAAAAVLVIGGRRLIGRLVARDPTNPDPPYISRVSYAFWSTLLRSAAIAVFLLVTWYLFDSFNVLRGDIGVMLAALFVVIALVLYVHRLAHAILSPRRPNWRLVDIEPKPARLLIALLTLTAAVTGIDYMLSEIYRVMGSPLALTVGENLVATVLVGLLIILVASVRPFLDETGQPKPWPLLLRALLYGIGVLTVVAALAGYIGFAKFVSQQVVITGAIVAMMYVGILSARAVAEEGAFAGTALGRRLATRYGFSETTVDQIGLVTSILINILVFIAGIPLILLQWGFRWGDIRSLAFSLANEIRIGTVTVSLVGIATGIVLFIVGFFVTRWFQRWLDGSVMARGRVDAGVRNSIRTAVGYAGVALAGLIGISAAGIDLSNLALVAGALSLGIGFGLQNIVSNFVSGLILLAERPFKVGDWIVAGTTSGTVRKISVRATEIETFQRQTVIMPNSELINAAVGNWTLRNKLGRVEVRVSVAYGQDVERAHAILTDIARSHPLVLKNPEPFVLFANFGPAGLEFEIRVFLADVLNGSTVQTDIRCAVLRAFAAAGIEIPSTPRAQGERPAAPAVAEELAPPVHPEEDEPARSPASRRRRKPDPDAQE